MKFFIFDEDIIEIDQRFNPFEEFGDVDGEWLSFRVNGYLTLNFDGNATHIYVKGKRFIQCIRLILNIDTENIERYDDIESIDDALKIYERQPIFGYTHKITPKEEFQGHCSNIQTWAENNYDTRILHTNIAFPLLRELTEAGDPQAKKIFKDEIAERYEKGNKTVRQYLKAEGYIKYLSGEELQTLLDISGEYLNSFDNIAKNGFENSHKNSIIGKIISYYLLNLQKLGKERSYDFLESCKEKMIDLFLNSPRKSKIEYSNQYIKDITMKRQHLMREISKFIKNAHGLWKLKDLLITIKTLIKSVNPETIESILESFLEISY
ncbi:MAG: hypothetical protein V3V33_11090 [Candidatus Lokiarchaeia archaeon]